jgi:hypothetical protein
MRGFGGPIILVISGCLFFLGLWRLAKARRWKILLAIFATLLAYIYIVTAVSNIPDDHLRLWVVVLAILPLPGMLLSGFFVYRISENKKLLEEFNSPSSVGLRYRGAISLIIGFSAWLLGAFYPIRSITFELVVLAIALYGVLLGTWWVFTGRKLYG